MTPLNTIIEEEVEAYKNDYAQAITDVGGFGLAKHIERFLTTAMQRAYDAGANNERASWLRSEIEKLEKRLKKVYTEKKINRGLPNTQVFIDGYLHALNDVITRYKEELKVLESKI